VREKWASIVYIAHKQKSERNNTRGQGRQQQQQQQKQPPNKLGLCLFIHTFRDTLGEKKVERKQQPLLYLLYIFPTTKVFKEVGNFFKSTTSKLGIFPAAFFNFILFFRGIFEAFRRQAIPGKII
jgi:hypothetical protein